MTQPPNESVPPSGRSDGKRENVDALVRCIEEDSARRDESLGTKSHRRRRGRARQIALVLALLANGYLWIGRPSWLVGEPDGVQSVEDEEGLLRYRIYLQASRIVNVVRETGEPPEGLGSPVEGIVYIRTGPDSWELVGETERARLTYRSSEPLAEFLARR